MQLTRQQIEQNIEAMEQQGAKPEEIQGYLNSLGSSSPTPADAKQEGSVIGDMGRAIIRTPLRIASGVAPMAETIYAGLENLDGSNDFTKEDIDRRNVEGRNFGALGQNIRPIGYQGSEINMRRAAGERVSAGDIAKAGGQMTAGAVGSAFEIASYAYAPLRGATSAKGMLWQAGTSKAIGTFTAGEAGQAIEAGKGVGQITGEAAGNYIAATVATAALGKGGQMFQKWGGRLLRSEAVVRNANKMKNLFSSISDTFGDDVTRFRNVDYDANLATNRSVGAFQRQFKENITEMRDSVIDTMQPTVKNADQVFHEAKITMRKKIGNFFKIKDELYDAVKRDSTKVTFEIGNASKLLNQFKSVGDDFLNQADDQTKNYFEVLKSQGLSVREAAAAAGLKMDDTNPVVPLLEMIQERSKKGITAGEMLDFHSQLLKMGNELAEPDDAKMVNEIAANLFNETRDQLKGIGREDLVRLMDDAYVGHQKAVDLIKSRTLSRFKSAGEFDTFMSDFIDKGFKNEAERNLFTEVAGTHPNEIRGLVLNNVLRRIRETNVDEGNKILNKFLGDIDTKKFSWAKSTLQPEDLDFLSTLRDLTSKNFQDVIDAIQIQGTPMSATETELRELMAQHSVLKVGEQIKNFTMDEFGEGITNLFKRNPEAMGRIISNMSPDDQTLMRLTMMRRVFDSNLTVGSMNPDGSMHLDDSFVDAATKMISDIKTMQRRTQNKNLFGLFDDGMLKNLDEMVTRMRDDQIMRDVPQSQMKTVMAGIIGTFYAMRGWMPGAIHNYGKFVKGMSQDEQVYLEATERLMEGLRGNGAMNVGMILDELANTLNVGVMFSEALEGATTNNESE